MQISYCHVNAQQFAVREPISHLTNFASWRKCSSNSTTKGAIEGLRTISSLLASRLLGYLEDRKYDCQ